MRLSFPPPPDTRFFVERGEERSGAIIKSWQPHHSFPPSPLPPLPTPLTVDPFDLHHCNARWRLTRRSDSRSTLLPISTNGKLSGSIGAACRWTDRATRTHTQRGKRVIGLVLVLRCCRQARRKKEMFSLHRKPRSFRHPSHSSRNGERMKQEMVKTRHWSTNHITPRCP